MGGLGSGRKPRDYPQHLIDLVCGMYRDGMTVSEIRAVAPKGYRVQTILERHLPERRSAAKRNQRADANHMWKGDEAGYQAAHLRLGNARDHTCVDCGEQAQHWSYRGGDPDQKVGRRGVTYSTNPEFYEPRCVRCHHSYDYKGRRANGQWVAREEVMPNV